MELFIVLMAAVDTVSQELVVLESEKNDQRLLLQKIFEMNSFHKGRHSPGKEALPKPHRKLGCNLEGRMCEQQDFSIFLSQKWTLGLFLED